MPKVDAYKLIAQGPTGTTTTHASNADEAERIVLAWHEASYTNIVLAAYDYDRKKYFPVRRNQWKR